ncbi:MAG: aminoglycoside phosphotransferase family protein [Thermomicrobiales bacterium]
MTAIEPELIERIERAVGRRVVAWEAATGGGYTHIRRLIVHFADGSTAFAKIAVDELTAGWLRDEISVYRRVRGPYLPALLGADDGDPPLLVIEDLRLGHWPPPWRPGDVARVLEMLVKVHATEPPLDLRTLEELELLSVEWQRVAEEPEPFLTLGLCTRAWLEAALPTLLAAEAGVDLAGNDFCHLDVRSDNICLLNGRTVLIDWNNACRGNGEIDLLGWLPSLHLEGGPLPDEVAPDADPRLVAKLAGYWAWRAPLPVPPTAPRVREIQKRQLEVVLPWAARRLGLPPPDGSDELSAGNL